MNYTDFLQKKIIKRLGNGFDPSMENTFYYINQRYRVFPKINQAVQ